MARIEFRGLDGYELMISRLSKGADDVAGKAIYAGAAIVADEIRKEIQGLPIVSGYGTESKPLPGGVTKCQKQGLLDGLGISPMQDKNGYFNVKIGFDGYNSTRTDDYPNGQPNQLVARGVASGTSWKQKRPFVRLATRRAKKPAEAKMAEVLDEEITKIMDGAGETTG